MGVGVWQLALLLVIVVIVFGVGKLPNVMGDVGKGISSFKKGLKEGEDLKIESNVEAKVDSKSELAKKEKV